ncbi:hypothetical protein Tco_0355517 [Tanacetum coccineum]
MDSRTNETFVAPELKQWTQLLQDWNLVDRSLPVKISPVSNTVPSTVDTRYSVELADGKIHKAQVESLKTEKVKDENLHGMDKEFENRLDRALCIRRRSWLPRVRDLGELIKHDHGFYHKTTKNNKQLRHDLGNRDHQKSYADVRRKPLEFHVEGKKIGSPGSVLNSPRKEKISFEGDHATLLPPNPESNDYVYALGQSSFKGKGCGQP